MGTRFLTILMVGALFLNVISCGGGSQGGTTNPEDKSPDAFAIAPIEDAELDVNYLSDVVMITGFDGEVQLSVEGCLYKKNNVSDFVGEPSSVSTGDSLQFELMSANEYGVETVCSITVGDYATNFSVRTINLYATAHFYYYLSGGGDDIVAIPESVYLHGSDGEEMEPLSVAEDGGIQILGTNPRAYSAYFKRVVGENTYYFVYTNLSPSVDETFSMPAYERVEPDIEDLKTISFDATNMAFPSESIEGSTYIGLSSSNFWIRPLISAQTSNSLIEGEFLLVPEDAGVNDVMFYVTSDTREILGYNLYNTRDWQDSDVIEVSDLSLNFLPLSIVNDAEGEARFDVYGYPEGASRPIIIARYTAEPKESKGDVKMISHAFAKYRHRVQFSDYFSGIEHTSQTAIYSDARPLELSTDYSAGRVSYAEVHYDDGVFQLDWSAEDIPQYEFAEIRIYGFTDSEERFTWYGKAPNSGSVTLRPLPNGVGFSSVLGIEVRISFTHIDSNSSENEDYQRLTLFMPISCLLGDCKFVSTASGL